MSWSLVEAKPARRESLVKRSVCSYTVLISDQKNSQEMSEASGKIHTTKGLVWCQSSSNKICIHIIKQEASDLYSSYSLFFSFMCTPVLKCSCCVQNLRKNTNTAAFKTHLLVGELEQMFKENHW